MIKNTTHRNYEKYNLKEKLWALRKKTMEELKNNQEILIKKIKFEKTEIKNFEKKKRFEQYLKEYKNLGSLERVAKIHGVTRERIRQVLCQSPEFSKKYLDVKQAKMFKTYFVHCKNKKCKNLIKIISPHNLRIYCSRACKSGPKLTPEQLKVRTTQRKAKKAEYGNYYYHNILKKRPDFKEIIKQRNDKYKKYRV